MKKEKLLLSEVKKMMKYANLETLSNSFLRSLNEEQEADEQEKDAEDMDKEEETEEEEQAEEKKEEGGDKEELVAELVGAISDAIEELTGVEIEVQKPEQPIEEAKEEEEKEPEDTEEEKKDEMKMDEATEASSVEGCPMMTDKEKDEEKHLLTKEELKILVKEAVKKCLNKQKK